MGSLQFSRLGTQLSVFVVFSSFVLACTTRRGGGKSDDEGDGSDGASGFQADSGADDGSIGSDGSDGAVSADGTDAGDAADGVEGSPASDGQTDAADGSTDSCSTDAQCKTFKSHCGSAGLCVECVQDQDCPAPGEVCFQDICTGCVPGVRTCSGTDVTECQDGTPKIVESCPVDGVCNSGKCYACYPGVKKCDEQGHATECLQDGSGWKAPTDCAAQGLQCATGICVSECGNDPKGGTNAGCEFWAVDLENIAAAQSSPYAVIASNTSSTAVAKVTVTLPDTTQQVQEIAPLSLAVFELPPENSLQGGGITKQAYHVTSTRPITVYQFNPLSNVAVYSNDASVLLPVASAGTDYRVMTLADINGEFHGYVVVVGLQNGTSVEVTPNADATAGAAGSLSAGAKSTFTLGVGEVLNVLGSSFDGDMTGTLVHSDKPVLVYAGHQLGFTSNVCCGDHLEQQMVPVPAWGTSYILARTKKRLNEPEYFRIVAHEDGTQVTVNPAVIQPPTFTLNAGQFKQIVFDGDFQVSATKPIMAAQFIASSGEVLGSAGVPCSLFDTCSFDELCVGGTCLAICSSNSECGVSQACTVEGFCEPVGDPTLILAVSEQQWQTSYVFLTPDNYLEDYVTVVAPEGAGVTIDGALLPDGAFEPISGSSFRVYRGAVADGVHVLQAAVPVSIIVYGYDADVSYGYPGGLGVAKLKP